MSRALLRSSLVLLSLGLAPMMVGAQSAPASFSSAAGFQGRWVLHDSKAQFGHDASVDLTLKDGTVHGQWSEGTRVFGEDGELEGQVQGQRLHVRYCFNQASGNEPECPTYEAVSSDYFVRQGPNLVWYRKSGQGASATFERYAVLKPSR